MKTAHVMLSLFVLSCTAGALQAQVAATATASVVIQTVDIPRSKTKAQIDWTNQRVEVTSYGLPKKGVEHPGQKRLTAREAALAIGYRDLAAVVAGVNVNSIVTVKDCMLESSEVRTQISAFIQGARVTKEEWNREDEIYTVTMVLGMVEEEGPSVQTIIAPELPKIEAKLREEKPQLFTEPEPQIPETPVEPAEAMPSRRPGPYTGLIVDVRGYGGRPCMSPKIVRADGSEVWGTLKSVGTDYAGRHGIVGWLPDFHFAMKHERAGDNPLVIRAIGVQGSYQANAVVSDADAALILEANQASRDHFLENCKVIFVLESPRKQRDMREAETAGKL